MAKKISDQENIAGLRLSLEEQYPIQDYVGDDKEFQTSEEWVAMIDSLLEQEILKVKSMGTEGTGDDVTADTLYVTLNDAGGIDTEFPVGPANIDRFKKQYPNAITKKEHEKTIGGSIDKRTPTGAPDYTFNVGDTEYKVAQNRIDEFKLEMVNQGLAENVDDLVPVELENTDQEVRDLLTPKPRRYIKIKEGQGSFTTKYKGYDKNLSPYVKKMFKELEGKTKIYYEDQWVGVGSGVDLELSKEAGFEKYAERMGFEIKTEDLGDFETTTEAVDLGTVKQSNRGKAIVDYNEGIQNKIGSINYDNSKPYIASYIFGDIKKRVSIAEKPKFTGGHSSRVSVGMPKARGEDYDKKMKKAFYEDFGTEDGEILFNIFKEADYNISKVNIDNLPSQFEYLVYNALGDRKEKAFNSFTDNFVSDNPNISQYDLIGNLRLPDPNVDKRQQYVTTYNQGVKEKYINELERAGVNPTSILMQEAHDMKVGKVYKVPGTGKEYELLPGWRDKGGLVEIGNSLMELNKNTSNLYEKYINDYKELNKEITPIVDKINTIDNEISNVDVNEIKTQADANDYLNLIKQREDLYNDYIKSGIPSKIERNINNLDGLNYVSDVMMGRFDEMENAKLAAYSSQWNYDMGDRLLAQLELSVIAPTVAMGGGALSLITGAGHTDISKDIWNRSIDYFRSVDEGFQKEFAPIIKWADLGDEKIGGGWWNSFGDWTQQAIADNSFSILAVLGPGWVARGISGMSKKIATTSGLKGLRKGAATRFLDKRFKTDVLRPQMRALFAKQAQDNLKKATAASMGAFFVSTGGSNLGQTQTAWQDAEQQIKDINFSLYEVDEDGNVLLDNNGNAVFKEKDPNKRRELLKQLDYYTSAKDSTMWQRALSAVLYGSIEMFAEKFGTLRYVNGMRRASSILRRTNADDIFVKGWRTSKYWKNRAKSLWKGTKQTGRYIAVENVEEILTQFGHNLTDMVVMENWNKSIFDGIDEDLIANTTFTSMILQGPRMGGNIYNTIRYESSSAKDRKKFLDLRNKLLQTQHALNNSDNMTRTQIDALRKNKKELMEQINIHDFVTMHKFARMTMEERESFLKERREQNFRESQYWEATMNPQFGVQDYRKMLEGLEKSVINGRERMGEMLGNKHWERYKTIRDGIEKDSEGKQTWIENNIAQPMVYLNEYAVALAKLNFKGDVKELTEEDIAELAIEAQKDPSKYKDSETGEIKIPDFANKNAWVSEDGKTLFINTTKILSTIAGKHQQMLGINEKGELEVLGESYTGAITDHYERFRAAIAPLHELIHAEVRSKKIFTRSPELNRAAEAASQSMLDWAEKQVAQGRMDQNILDKIKNILKRYTKNDEIDAEEILTTMGEAIIAGDITPSNLSEIAGIKYFLNTLATAINPNLGHVMNPFKTAEDMHQFLTRFTEKTLQQSTPVAIPDEEEQDIKFSEAVQQVGDQMNAVLEKDLGKLGFSLTRESLKDPKALRELKTSLYNNFISFEAPDKYKNLIANLIKQQLISGRKAKPVDIARGKIYNENLEGQDGFIEKVKMRLFEGTINRFDPEKAVEKDGKFDPAGFIVSELVNYRIGDELNKIRPQGAEISVETVLGEDLTLGETLVSEEPSPEEILDKTLAEERKAKEIKAREKKEGKKIYPKRTKARQDFKDIKSITEDIKVKLIKAIPGAITKALGKEGVLIENELLKVLDKELVKILSKELGKIGEKEGKIVVPQTYIDFINNEYEGLVRSIPIDVIKKSYGELFNIEQIEGTLGREKDKKVDPLTGKITYPGKGIFNIDKPTKTVWVDYHTKPDESIKNIKSRKNKLIERQKGFLSLAARDIVKEGVKDYFNNSDNVKILAKKLMVNMSQNLEGLTFFDKMLQKEFDKSPHTRHLSPDDWFWDKDVKSVNNYLDRFVGDFDLTNIQVRFEDLHKRRKKVEKLYSDYSVEELRAKLKKAKGENKENIKLALQENFRHEDIQLLVDIAGIDIYTGKDRGYTPGVKPVDLAINNFIDNVDQALDIGKGDQKSMDNIKFSTGLTQKHIMIIGKKGKEFQKELARQGNTVGVVDNAIDIVYGKDLTLSRTRKDKEGKIKRTIGSKEKFSNYIKGLIKDYETEKKKLTIVKSKVIPLETFDNFIKNELNALTDNEQIATTLGVDKKAFDPSKYKVDKNGNVVEDFKDDIQSYVNSIKSIVKKLMDEGIKDEDGKVIFQLETDRAIVDFVVNYLSKTLAGASKVYNGKYEWKQNPISKAWVLETKAIPKGKKVTLRYSALASNEDIVNVILKPLLKNPEKLAINKTKKVGTNKKTGKPIMKLIYPVKGGKKGQIIYDGKATQQDEFRNKQNVKDAFKLYIKNGDFSLNERKLAADDNFAKMIVIADMYKDLIKEGKATKLDAFMWIRGLLGDMRTILRGGANLKYTIKDWKKFSKNFEKYEYEHLIPAKVVALYLAGYIAGTKTIEDLEKLQKQYNVAIIPSKEMEDIISEWYKDTMPFIWNLDMSNALVRYFNSKTYGEFNFSIIDLFDNKEYGKEQPNAYKEIQKAKKENEKLVPKMMFSEGLSQIEIISQLENLDKAIEIAKDINAPKKGISIFDFDDTVAKTKSKIIVNMPQNLEGLSIFDRMLEEEFAKSPHTRHFRAYEWFWEKDFKKVIHGRMYFPRRLYERVDLQALYERRNKVKELELTHGAKELQAKWKKAKGENKENIEIALQEKFKQLPFAVEVSGINIYTGKEGELPGMKLTPAEFAKRHNELMGKGAKFDFSEFTKVVGGKKGPLFDKLQKAINKFGNENVFILTARPQESAAAIQAFLKGLGAELKIENITGLEDGRPAAKAQWVVNKAAEGYNDFYFTDDVYKNVRAVQKVLDVIDVKRKIQQAKTKFSKGIDQDFNLIIERKTGIRSVAEYSKAKASVVGSKKRGDLFITSSAEDFMGMMYKLLGKGKQGDLDKQWIKEVLERPFAKAYAALANARMNILVDFKALKKQTGITSKDLRKEIPGGFTNEHAVRIYIWNKLGYKVPGLSKTDLNSVLNWINKDEKLLSFAEKLIEIQQGDIAQPKDSWLVGNIGSDVADNLIEVKRFKYLKEWRDNKNIVFSEKNLNKLEAAFGKSYRIALENILKRMETGVNRDYEADSLTGNFMNWVNGSVGAVMFFNTRSALLQSISMVNFINWSDNNIAKASLAFANQPQFWSDFMYLMNSNFLKDRRAGLKVNISESEVAEMARKGGVQGVINGLLKFGFLPTQIMDSFAIAMGGATFYRNRINSLLKRQNPETGETYTRAEAEQRAFEDFQEIAEENQQSSRPDRISMQQAGPLGRVILAFANTPMQYARLMKKAYLDLVNKRGDWRTNVSKLIYYSAVQNLIFNAIQQALFAIAFGDDEDDDEKNKSKIYKVINSMTDSILRGTGFYGAAGAAIKNAIIKHHKESKEDTPEYEEVVFELLKFSPTLGSKVGKIRSWGRTLSWDAEEIQEAGFGLDSPAYLAYAQLLSAATNIPLDRIIQKIENINYAFSDNAEVWERMALLGGWKDWEIGFDPDAIQDELIIRNNKTYIKKRKPKKKKIKVKKKKTKVKKKKIKRK